jgi:hypothetical protein
MRSVEDRFGEQGYSNTCGSDDRADSAAQIADLTLLLVECSERELVDAFPWVRHRAGSRLWG